MIKKKKILFTTENVTWGGSELLWSRTVVELVNQKYFVGICVAEKLKLPAELLSLEFEKKVIIFRAPSRKLSKVKQVLNRFLPYRFRLKSKDKREQFIQQFNPDLQVINQGYNFNAVDLMSFAKKSKIKYVNISQAVNEGLWPNEALRQKMISGFTGSVMNYFVSHDNQEVTQAQLGHKLVNNEVIRNPFNVPFLNDISYPNQETYSLACVGRFDFFAKGQDVLLRVLEGEKWKQRNLVVNFYGEGQDLNNLKDLIKLYQIKNAIIHEHTKTIEIWKNNHGLILTSRFEGLPLVLVEAMLCKRFAVITNVSGNKELLLDNETGFIAAAPRPEYIDEALERAWRKRGEWESMGKKAREIIIQQLPENPALVFANKLVDILNSNK